MNKISINGRLIDEKNPPFIIAEMSGNHNMSRDRALRIVEKAAEAGVHAIKLQTYTADTMTINLNKGEFLINDAQSLWKGKTLYQLYQRACTPWEWHEKIFARCRELGMICFSSPFDETAVDFLEELGTPCYKIASYENIHIPLIKKAAKTGKPIIISTGMAYLGELDEAVRAVKETGNNNVILLKCTSSYPADPNDSNLKTIPHLKKLFNCQVGLSDHTLGIGAAVASVALGSSIIEKHFTLSRAEGGVDAAFSLEPAEMKALVTETRRAWESLGNIKYGPTEKEKDQRKLRRSLYITEDMKKGEVLTENNLRAVRPGLGLLPKYKQYFLGKTVCKDIEKGTPLKWDLI